MGVSAVVRKFQSVARVESTDNPSCGRRCAFGGLSREDLKLSTCDGDRSERGVFFATVALSHTIETSYVILRVMKVVGRKTGSALDKRPRKSTYPV